MSTLAGVLALLASSGTMRAQPTEKTVYFWSVFSGRLPSPNFGARDGPANLATFNGPAGLALSPNGRLYLTDSWNETVREIGPDGSVLTFAGLALVRGHLDGVGPAARFHRPIGIAVSPSGTIHVVEEFNGTVRQISPARRVTTLAGSPGNFGQSDGTGAAAQFYFPRGIAVDTAGTTYVADTVNNSIRRISATGVVTTLAGLPHPGAGGDADGTGQLARFSGPDGLAVDPAGNLIVADSRNHLIRRITPAGVVTTIAGASGVAGSADGPATVARFRQPFAVAVDAWGTIFVADTFNSTIRLISRDGGVKTIGGRPSETLFLDAFPGLGMNARLLRPQGIVVHPNGTLFMLDGNVVWRGDPMLPPEVATEAPRTIVALEGETVTLAANATGTPAPALQWLRNGTAIPGATRPTLTLSPVSEADAALYTLVATSPAGVATLDVTTLRLGPIPALTQPLQAIVTTADGTVLLQVSATGRGPLSYVWRRDGTILPGEADRVLLTSVAGLYTVTVANAAGEVVSAPVEVGSRLANVSARASATPGGAPLIVGVVVSGPAAMAKQLLIRGVGPMLASFGVPDAMREPILTAYRSSAPIGISAGWDADPMAAQIRAAALAVGAFALPAGSHDSALLATVGAGAYTVHVTDRASGGGSALLELYETNAAGGGRIANLSFRGDVARGPLIVGFVVGGQLPARLLVRAVGPALAQFGVSGSLARPQLRLRTQAALLHSNAGWSTAANAAQLATAAAAQGAFALPDGSDDAALFVTLPPGAYTVEVDDAAGASAPAGEALVEIYHVTGGP